VLSAETTCPSSNKSNTKSSRGLPTLSATIENEYRWFDLGYSANSISHLTVASIGVPLSINCHSSYVSTVLVSNPTIPAGLGPAETYSVR